MSSKPANAGDEPGGGGKAFWLGVTLRCRRARLSLACAQRRERSMNHLAFSSELELLDCLLDPKPANIIGFMIVIAHVTF
jgi:hypothetical protein